MAYINFSGNTTTSIIVNAGTNLTSNVNGYRFFRDGIGEGSGITTFPAATSHSISGKTFSGLSPGTQYYLSITYYLNGTAVDSAGGYFSTQTPVAAPTNLVINASPANNSYAPANVSFSWSATGSGISYTWSSSTGSNGTGTSADLGLKGTGTYTINVTATNAGGSISGSNSVTLINPPPPPDTTAPWINPQSEVLTNVSIPTVRASWSAGDTNPGNGQVVSGFDRVEYFKSAPNDPSLNNFTSPFTSYQSSGSNDLTGWTEGATYYIFWRVWDKATPANMTQTPTGSIFIPITAPSAPTATYIEGGFNVQWASISGASSYQLEYKPTVNAQWQQVTTSTISVELALGQYGLQYDFRLRVQKSGIWSGFSSTSQYITRPKTPSISGSYINGTVTIIASGMAGNWSSIVVERRLKSNGSVQDTKTINTNGGNVQWSIPTNISLYTFRAYSFLDGPNISSVSYSNSVEFARPNNFSWQYSNIAANAVAEIDHRDWNNLGQRIRDFQAYKGITPSTFTTVTTGMELFATYFNAYRNAIAAMSPVTNPPSTKTGLSSVPSDPSLASDVYASDIDLLRISLNSIQ